MELLQYKYRDAYIIQASSTDIAMSWRKFKVRAKQLLPEKYCNYVIEGGGELQIYNADSQQMEEVEEADWHEARPVFFEDHKYNLTLTFFDAIDEPRIIHPSKEVVAMFNTIHAASGEYVVKGV